MLDEAAESAGLCRRNWHRQGSGDGELALVPPGEPEARVLDQYVRAIGALLFGHNQDHRYDERLRLRLAVDHGPVDLAANGFAGRPVVAVSRLVNSAVLRLALATSHADLAVIVSGRTYTDLVLGGHTSVPSADFRMVPIREKEFHEAAWLRVPGVDVHVLDLGIENQPAADPPAGWQPNGQTVVNHITGRVDAPGSVIGIRNG